MTQLTMLQRLADREKFTLRLTYFPPSSWGVTVKPAKDSLIVFRVPRQSDHIHYHGPTMREALESVLLHHYEDFAIREVSS